jgi:hypothetical protein
MTSLVDEILFAFANERDTNGNEYKLRYPPSQPRNRRFAEQVTSMFPTRLIKVAHSRSDADVTAAMSDPAHIAQWRARYAVLPSNTEALVAAWLPLRPTCKTTLTRDNRRWLRPHASHSPRALQFVWHRELCDGTTLRLPLGARLKSVWQAAARAAAV